jgi:UDPglucose 6-dehydrogenase
MKIIIAGYGFVGKAVGQTLQTKHEIVIVDPKYTTDEIKDHPDADGLIICVDTPTTEDGVCDVRNIADILDSVPIFMPVMIKSTVIPSVLESFDDIYKDHSIVYSPEFLRAATSAKDFAEQKFMIIGGEDPEGFWQETFSSVLLNCKLFFQCTKIEAAMAKYSVNSFLSAKVAFFNQLFDMCEANGADYSIVRQMITHDQRIGSSHTLVPGLDQERGFGGACFPKDTQAFIKYAKTINSPFSILETSVEYNTKVRKNA